MFRSKLISILMIILLITALIPIGTYATLNDSTLDTVEYMTGAVIVQYEENFKDKDKYEKEFDMIPEKNLGKNSLKLYKFNKNKDVMDIVEKLNKKKGIRFAEPNYLYQPVEITENYFSSLWGLYNSNDIDIDAPEAWDITKGSNQITVAVIDSGVQTTHEDLFGQFDFEKNFHYDPFDSYEDHGTHVSGTIAALDNNLGVVGVSPNIRLIALKFLGENGGYTDDAIDAINEAKSYGANIINASWGGGGYSLALKEAIENFGGPFVAAAGNDKTNTDRRPHYPSSYNSANIISVAAVDRNGLKPRFSNYGSVSVDVGAPGVGILSTFPTDSKDQFASFNGTSMAAPHVAGTLALMMSYDNSLTTQEYINILYATVDPLDSLSGKTSTGGMINAHKALLAMEYVEPVDYEPYVSSTIPDDESTDVDISTSIEINFSELVYSPTTIDGIEITGLVDPEYPVPTLVGYTPSQVDGTLKLTLTLDNVLDYSRTYEVHIPAGIVMDATDNPSIAYDFTFTTKALPPPVVETTQVVESIVPINKARNVPTGSTIDVTFTEIITLKDPNKVKLIDKSNFEIPVTITFYDMDMNVSVDNSGKFMILKPASLDPNMRYTIRFNEGAFETDTHTLSEFFTSVFTTVRK
ncbi:MAG: S8 family serine peptidase [Clostridiales bacterium]|nr:S8 family serine peptidase [Clostridiales bacterium]